jgi:hypothetical protein
MYSSIFIPVEPKNELAELKQDIFPLFLITHKDRCPVPDCSNSIHNFHASCTGEILGL